MKYVKLSEVATCLAYVPNGPHVIMWMSGCYIFEFDFHFPLINPN